jgi:hypothetical protein
VTTEHRLKKTGDPATPYEYRGIRIRRNSNINHGYWGRWSTWTFGGPGEGLRSGSLGGLQAEIDMALEARDALRQKREDETRARAQKEAEVALTQKETAALLAQREAVLALARLFNPVEVKLLCNALQQYVDNTDDAELVAPQAVALRDRLDALWVAAHS